jgi:glycosyltransferase involved in cell wall biosynthesis
VVLPSETGLLVPQRSPDTLAAALDRVLRDDTLRRRLGESARRHAELHFDPRKNTATVMSIYDRVLAEVS